MKWTKTDYNKWLSEGSPVNTTVTDLNISRNHLTTIIPVNNLPNLQILYCCDNQIVDIQGLQLPNLQTLRCGYNQIVDIQGLQLPNLQALDCRYNQIVDIQGLQLPNLQTLRCGYNQIVDIQGLQFPNLQSLDCGFNQIVNIQGLQLPNLQILHCYCNQIVNIQGLPLPNLHALICYSNQIVDIQGIQLPNLQELDCSLNQITNLSFRFPMPYLQKIHYSNNPIEYIAPNIHRLLNRSNQQQNVYTDSQNVHNHHIQESIRNSIRQVMAIQPTITNLSDFIIQDEDLTGLTKSLLLDYMTDETIHSTLDISFSELLLNVMSLIETNEHKKEIKTILNQEMNDAQCKCYTGRMSRLVNCLNGYTDCVQIQISDTEQIGYVIQLVRQELETSDEYSVERHKELVRMELFDRHYSELVINEWVDYIE
jgi:Leucine-rich repeat (LRR) protein